jgi:hypothetical protein
MRLLNTNNHTDLKKFAQAQFLVNFYQVINLKDIVLLEFGGSNVLVDYLLFKVKGLTYCYRAGKLKVDNTVNDFETVELA